MPKELELKKTERKYNTTLKGSDLIQDVILPELKENETLRIWVWNETTMKGFFLEPENDFNICVTVTEEP